MPKVIYPDLVDEGNYVAVTNLLTRSAFIKEILDNSSFFYEYQVRDNETPEMIAHKLYGDVNRYWIVLLFNNLKNPFYDFPLNSEQLATLITNKYALTVEDSLTTIHHYERRITKSVLLSGSLQGRSTDTYIIEDQVANATTGLVEATPYLPGTADSQIDYETTTEAFSSSISVVSEYSHHAISTYAYESSENEKRRNISLLDKRYVPIVEKELKRLMK